MDAGVISRLLKYSAYKRGYYQALEHMQQRKMLLGVFIVNLIVLIGMAVFYELFIALMLAQPRVAKALPKPLLWHIREVYHLHDISIIQFHPQFAYYDPVLTYTLKPGEFVFSNREFATAYYVNTLGVRDDEESLIAPQIVVLGDSHAMGWGVEQHETFAQILEQATGYRVLNAAISSYGTVREMRMLDRIDTSGLKYLIIQYCENDYNENLQFYQKGSLEIMERNSYTALAERGITSNRYYPGKYIMYQSRTLMSLVQNNIFQRLSLEKAVTKEARLENEAEIFLHTLENASRTNLQEVQIIGLALNTFLSSDKEFITALQAKKNHPRYPRYIQDLIAVELSTMLDADRYGFILDNHMLPKGHALVARQLLPYIR